MDLSNIERQRKLMAALPVDEVWGIGRRIGKKLDVMGIKTVLDLADTDIRFIRKHFSVVLERTVRELRGEPCLALEEFAPDKQEIICSRSFGEKLTDYNAMRGHLHLCFTCCGKAAQRTPVLPVYLYVYQNQSVCPE